MNYRYLKLDPRMDKYVRTVLLLEHSSDAKSSDLPLFTAGMPALLYRAGNSTYSITLFGQSVPDDKWEIENNEMLIAWFFKSFALSTIFKISAKDLKEKPVELNLWNAQKAMALNVQLFHSGSASETVTILNDFIFSQVQANQRECEIIRHATDTLMQNSATDMLSKLLQDLNLTERTLQRIFKKYVGITANDYRRICQHYFAFSQLKGGHFDKLTDVAYDNGYFDQSHYIRAFKEFTDTTPNEYLQSGLMSHKDMGHTKGTE